VGNQQMTDDMTVMW